MPKSTPRPTNRTANATEIGLSASTIHSPTAAVTISPTTRLTKTARMMRAFFSASHSTPQTSSDVTTAFRSAPSAMVSNSSSDRTTDPVRRTLTPRSGVNPSLATASRIAAVALPPGARSAKSRTGRMITKRRNSEGFAARPAISVRHEKAGVLPSTKACSASAIAERRPQVVQLGPAKANAFERLRQRAQHAAEARIRSSVPRNGCAEIRSAVLRRTSSRLRNRMPLRSKNSPSTRSTVPSTSDRGASSFTSASAAWSAASGVAASITARIRLIRSGKARSIMTSCWRHGSEFDISFAVGADGDMPREVAGAQSRDQEGGEDHGPRAANGSWTSRPTAAHPQSRHPSSWTVVESLVYLMTRAPQGLSAGGPP